LCHSCRDDVEARLSSLLERSDLSADSPKKLGQRGLSYCTLELRVGGRVDLTVLLAVELLMELVHRLLGNVFAFSKAA